MKEKFYIVYLKETTSYPYYTYKAYKCYGSKKDIQSKDFGNGKQLHIISEPLNEQEKNVFDMVITRTVSV